MLYSYLHNVQVPFFTTQNTKFLNICNMLITFGHIFFTTEKLCSIITNESCARI
jgi:hypothetical protein